MRGEELYVAAALAGLCQHSAAFKHCAVDELAARAVALGRAVAKAHAEAVDGEETPAEKPPVDGEEAPGPPAKRKGARG